MCRTRRGSCGRRRREAGRSSRAPGAGGGACAEGELLLDGPKPFRPCQPDVQLFPLALWNRLRGRALRKTNRSLLHYHSEAVLGFRPLRENLAAYLRDSRGVVCEWWQIAITTGSQQALYLLANLLLKQGDRVYMENPGYSGAVRAWRSAGATLEHLPIDAQGMVFPAAGRGVGRAGVCDAVDDSFRRARRCRWRGGWRW